VFMPRLLTIQLGSMSNGEEDRGRKHTHRCDRSFQIDRSALKLLCNSLTGLHVGLATWDCRDVLRIRKDRVKVLFKHLPYRLPMSSGRFHGNMLDPKLFSQRTSSSRSRVLQPKLLRRFWGLLSLFAQHAGCDRRLVNV
jgi:hypothetical protein